jgi:hypothetical protein
MTAFTPEIKIYQYPPGTDLQLIDIGTEVTDLVDYDISISDGTSQYITPPYPSQGTVTLLFYENRIPDIYLGSYVQVVEVSSGSNKIIFEGYVINRKSSYREYGLTGFILEWTFTLASGISILQNTSWYNPNAFTGTTEECIDRIKANYGYLLWSQVNSNTDWTEIGGETWEDFDAPRKLNLPEIVGVGETTQQHLAVGFRNVWDDLVTLVYGVYGYILELNSVILCHFLDDFGTSSIPIPQNIIGTDITAEDSLDTIRNIITVTEYTGTQSKYYDENSITLYQERSGSIDTYLTSTLDAANIGQILLNSLAFPILGTEQISLNLLNPNMTTQVRNELIYGRVGTSFEVDAPLPMGGKQVFVVIGSQTNINKNSYIVTVNLALRAAIVNNLIWEQVPYNYTWTSYGVAFPTRKWQDL